MIGLAPKQQKLLDYFTPEEAEALVAAATSYPTRMTFRIVIRTGLRVSEALSLRRNEDPPVLSIRPEAPCNKAREVPIPADLLEGMADLASFHSNDRIRPMLDISRRWVGESMKRAAMAAGIDPARAHPHAFRHTYGRNCVLQGIPLPVLQQWLRHQPLADTQRYVELASAHPHGWPGCKASSPA